MASLVHDQDQKDGLTCFVVDASLAATWWSLTSWSMNRRWKNRVKIKPGKPVVDQTRYRLAKQCRYRFRLQTRTNLCESHLRKENLRVGYRVRQARRRLQWVSCCRAHMVKQKWHGPSRGRSDPGNFLRCTETDAARLILDRVLCSGSCEIGRYDMGVICFSELKRCNYVKGHIVT